MESAKFKSIETDDAIGGVILGIIIIAAWITSFVVCITKGLWVLLLLDVFVAPIGVLHGACVWLGVC